VAAIPKIRFCRPAKDNTGVIKGI
jgi:hypothetical protein